LRPANWQLNNIVTDQMFTFALLSRFRCFSCSNLRRFELKVKKKVIPVSNIRRTLSPKNTSITNLSNQNLTMGYALLWHMTSFFPGVNANHRAITMNTDPSAYKDIVSCNALPLIFCFIERAKPWKYQDIIQIIESWFDNKVGSSKFPLSTFFIAMKPLEVCLKNMVNWHLWGQIKKWSSLIFRG
jgi:hypothetical protein